MIKKYWIHGLVIIAIIFIILLFVDFNAWNNFLKKEKGSKDYDNTDSVNNWVNTVISGTNNGAQENEPLFVYPRGGKEVAVLDKVTRKQLFKTKYMIGKFLRKTEDGKYYEVLWDEGFAPGLVYGSSVYVTKKK